MAEAGSGGSWWTSMLTAAKEKSASALSATKRDLAEFVTVLSNDTSVVVKNASENIKGLINDDPAEEDGRLKKTSQPRIPTSSSSSSLTASSSSHPPGVPYDRTQAQLYTLQSSPDTFLTDPPEGINGEEEYKKWTEEFDVQTRQTEISQLLVNCPHVRTLHGQLVPAKVSYKNFWQRYFFKLNLLQQEEQRRASLMARVQPQAPPDDLQWEELEEEEGVTTTTKQEVKKVCEEVVEEGGSGEKSKTSQNGDDEGSVGVSSSIVEIKSEHFRSESSDSFICVSEDLPQSDRSHASPDRNGGSGGGGGGGEWEYLKMAEVAEGAEASRESSDGGDLTLTATPVKQDRQEKEEEEEREGQREGADEKDKEPSGESSDWESWDD